MYKVFIAVSISLFSLLAWYGLASEPEQQSTQNQQQSASPRLAKATFAGGCFWCMEPPFDKLDGVISTVSGYAGGHIDNPSYKQVTSGRTGHTEAVQITFDPDKISYAELLSVYWINIDPTDATGQFCDKGSQYRSEVFYHDEGQHSDALASLQTLNTEKPFPQPIVTQISAFTNFFAAEDYHQDYYQRNPIRYKWYRAGCGRDDRLEALWGKKG